MMSLARFSARRWWTGAIFALQLTAACTATIGDNGKTSRGGSGSSSTTTGGGAIVDPITGKVIECDGSQVTNAKRLIRLSFNRDRQLAGQLVGNRTAQSGRHDLPSPRPEHALVSPLSNPRKARSSSTASGNRPTPSPRPPASTCSTTLPPSPSAARRPPICAVSNS